VKVVISFRLYKRGLAVLTDHDERRQEDRLERYDERQELKRVAVGAEESRRDPEREDPAVHPHEGHRARESRDLVGQAQLPVLSPPLLQMQDDGRVLFVVRGIDRCRHPGSPFRLCHAFDRPNCHTGERSRVRRLRRLDKGVDVDAVG
jgi:hypothetical protein